ncbi:hypothetical protein PABY_09200 [Pyrodictium abyssi]|uniref:Uncharacterized protein n=1 Tax=Pyrodictium abyssi TaxID=54256 RepID=A0ABM8IXM7_9CREN|nr:hypothetical protein PABY_09200 [Pyrodictium abyssi]
MYNGSSFMRIIDGFDSHMDAVAWLALEETTSGPVAGNSVITPALVLSTLLPFPFGSLFFNYSQELL